MKKFLILVWAIALAACNSQEPASPASAQGEHGEAAPAEVVKGPNRGRMFSDAGFTLELAIFETGVPPEFRAWATQDGKPIPASAVDLQVEVERLGKVMDLYTFKPQGVAPNDFLQAETSVYEPHSFVVTVKATHAAKAHSWSYESFEGRTSIDGKIAEAAGIKTEIAGPATLSETLSLYGQVVANPERQREVSARFPGVIRGVSKQLGDQVRAGDTLATVESNESLRTYAISSPLAGVITSRTANAGEQTGDRVLFTVTDTSSVLAELSVFPRDRARVQVGAAVRVRLADSETIAEGKIARVAVEAGSNQAVRARVVLDNREQAFLPGSFVTAEVVAATREVPLAVKTSGLQAFRDFTVVYAQVGDTYEVRMLELGPQNGEWVEVLDGLKPGTRYVTENSYLIKADIEKSAASHDH